MDAGAQNEEPTFDEALVMELLSRAAAEGGGQRAAANIKLTAGAAKTCGELLRLFVLPVSSASDMLLSSWVLLQSLLMLLLLLCWLF